VTGAETKCKKLIGEKSVREVNRNVHGCCPITRRENLTAILREDHVRLGSTFDKNSGFVGILIHSFQIEVSFSGSSQPLYLRPLK